jgi:hypothetical protein
MMSPDDFRVGGKGVSFVEGAHVVADDIDEVIAVDCPSVGVKDSGRATTIGCGRVEAFGTADRAAVGAGNTEVLHRDALRVEQAEDVVVGDDEQLRRRAQARRRVRQQGRRHVAVGADEGQILDRCV